jgi:hypothetical protein
LCIPILVNLSDLSPFTAPVRLPPNELNRLLAHLGTLDTIQNLVDEGDDEESDGDDKESDGDDDDDEQAMPLEIVMLEGGEYKRRRVERVGRLLGIIGSTIGLYSGE